MLLDLAGRSSAAKNDFWAPYFYKQGAPNGAEPRRVVRLMTITAQVKLLESLGTAGDFPKYNYHEEHEGHEESRDKSWYCILKSWA